MSLIGELIFVIFAGVIAGLAFALKTMLAKKIDNELFEKIMIDGVNYAEQMSKELLKNGAEKIDGSDKLEFAKKYISRVDPELFLEHKDDIESLIKAKVGELFGAS